MSRGTRVSDGPHSLVSKPSPGVATRAAVCLRATSQALRKRAADEGDSPSVTSGSALYAWTSARIGHQCHRAWLDYDAAKRDSYIAYFRAHPELAHPEQAWSAKDIAAALPRGW